MFHNAPANRREVHGPATEDRHPFLTVWPSGKRHNRLESFAPYHKRIDGCHELIVAVRFAATRRQKVEVTVRPRYVSIHAGTDKNRY